MYKKVEILLAFIDSYHDFGNLDKENNFICLQNLFYLLNKKEELNSINFLNKVFKNIIKEIFTFKNYINVNSSNFENLIRQEVFCHIKRDFLNINQSNENIILNFNKLFNFTINNSNFNTSTIFNTLISDDHKILLRQQLYYLISNKFNSKINSEIIDFFMDYMNLSIYDKETTNKIKLKILFNLQVLNFTNVVYPITFFDDNGVGLNIKNFRFNILNLDKIFIDEAKTASVDKYFINYESGKRNKNIIVNDETKTLVFNIDENKDKIKLIDTHFYLQDHNIISQYKNVKLSFTANTVGRSVNDDKNYGIYQITLLFINFFNLVNCDYKNKLEEHNDKLFKKVNNNKNKIQHILDSIEKITNKIINFDFVNQTNLKIMEILKKHYGYQNFNEKAILNKRTEILNIIVEFDFIKCLISKIQTCENDFLINVQKINNFIKKLNEAVLFLNNFGITESPTDYININDYDYELFKICNLINLKHEIKISKNNILSYLFFDYIYKNKQVISNTLVVNNLHFELANLFLLFKNDIVMGQGYLVSLMFGAKRFGDWIQMQLSKKLYFMLQTNDFYCKLYGYLIGAPVFFDDNIFNYMPNDISLTNENFKIISKNNQNQIITITDNLHLIYKSLRNIKTKEINRFYFNKYLKYKNKYLRLKKHD